ncbi:class I SAM-dependent methyltransferase [uncultured Methylobacterium sp.]|uniref:class I SAM-dependent methyltransferase n=1 Tax=uncultured Methylobacterium sp. TaxID=157278 RepID=UPI0026323A7B|nr:class I SAM-dependent methyltransferase [uncultured Methylobacterium sp.]
MIWIDDLIHLEPDYLARRFRPADQGLAYHDLARALSKAKPETRAHLLAHLAPSIREALTAAEDGLDPGAPDALLDSQMRLIGTYFWEIVYRKEAEIYDVFSRSQEFPFRELFPAKDYAGKVVVDLGCGTGKLAGYLQPLAREVIGVDPAEPLLGIARERYAGRPNSRFVQGSFDAIPLPTGSVDAIVSNMAFQHAEERGGDRGLAEMLRVLRPGGRMAIVVAHATTQKFLIARGFAERAVPGRLRWREPECCSPLLTMLYALSRDLENAAPEEAVEQRPAFLFAPDGWRPAWTHRCLAELARGRPVGELFHRGDPFAPIAVPVYERREA